jgi:hypothetical protein
MFRANLRQASYLHRGDEKLLEVTACIIFDVLLNLVVGDFLLLANDCSHKNKSNILRTITKIHCNRCINMSVETGHIHGTLSEYIQVILIHTGIQNINFFSFILTTVFILLKTINIRETVICTCTNILY